MKTGHGDFLVNVNSIFRYLIGKRREYNDEA